MTVPLLEINGVSKTYGGVRALRDVSLDLQAGEVHALVGENGAGKSTLIKILSGSVLPEAGSVRVAGADLRLGDVAASEAAGIATIHQESTAFPSLSAEDNIFVGREPRRCFGLLLDRARMRSETTALLQRLGEGNLDTRRPVGELSLAARQIVGMARALSRRSRLLILDEPTASLSAREAEALFAIVRSLQAEGVSLLYVSHRLDEVFALADRVTILRDGSRVETRPIRETNRAALIRSMVGRDLLETTETEAARAEPGPVVLAVQNLTRAGVFQEVSFSVRAGEIVGLAGMVGAGRSEVAQAVFGVDRPTSGSVRVSGKELPAGSVAAAIQSGVALVPEDRQHLGLVLPLSVGTNLLLTTLHRLTRLGFRSTRREGESIGQRMRDLSVRAASADVPAQTLSGGNQQKLVLGKWLAASPRVLILDEPTRGVDVGAKAEAYRLIRQLAAGGMATLLISSDLPELLALSDRILVMYGGGIVGELSRAGATEEKIVTLALGPSTAKETQAA